MTLSSDDLQAIRDRAEAATPGPWSRHDFGYPGEDEPSSIVVHSGEFNWQEIREGEFVASMPTWDRQQDDDALFISHARTDIPALLAHIDALEAERAEMTEEWGRAFWTNEYGERVLFVDDDNGAFRDYADVAQYVPPIHEESPYDFIVSRRVTPWLPVEEDQVKSKGRTIR